MENLSELKEEYAKIQKKHDLPSFDDLNRDFKIEKLSELETDFLIREIRGFVAETFEHFIRFVEALLNPVNVPMFLFPIIKSLGTKDKEKLTKIHKDIAKLEIDLIKLMNYSEENEAEFIKKSFKMWQGIKKDFVELIESLEKKWDVKTEKKNGGYFG